MSGAETWALRTVHQKYHVCFETWCWRRMEKIIWAGRVRNEEVLHRVQEKRNIIRTTKRRKANKISHILRRNCLLNHIIEGMKWLDDKDDLRQRFPNFFQVGTTFIRQNVLRTTLLLGLSNSLGLP